MTAKQILFHLISRSSSPFFLRANACVVPNVSWGLFSWGEADLIALSKSGYLTEGEIKVSKADFLKDKDKKKFVDPKMFKAWQKDIKNFYYIVPEELVDFALANTGHGVISVSKKGKVVRVRNSIPSKTAKKLPDAHSFNLLRLCCFRFWKLFKETSK